MLLDFNDRDASIMQSIVKEGARLSFSQFGEDLVCLNLLLSGEKRGDFFYVDVGCFDPFLYSNTAILHKHFNSNGINIDPNRQTIEKFVRDRPWDVNLELAISDTEETLTYTKFNHPAINTLSSKMAQIQESAEHKQFIKLEEISIKTVTLESVLDQWLPPGQKIDLLDIDAEGLDLKVLKSNNWEKYSPKIVLVELHGMSLSHAEINESYLFLKSKGYSFVAHMYATSLFLKS